jgi:peptidoglycan/LPS O-acetylase OafA/YrhL
MLPLNRTVIWDYTSLVVKWSWIALIIGFTRKYLNYTNSSLKYCNTLVYPFFILHQTVTIVLGYYVIDWGMSGMLEFLVIVVGTFVICSFLYELLIKRINILRILFGLKWMKSCTSANMQSKEKLKNS